MIKIIRKKYAIQAERNLKRLIVALLVLIFSAGCEGRFEESSVRILDANTGKPILDAVVYAEYVLEPQPTLIARMLPGLDHRAYSSICVATRLTTTSTNGVYALSKLTQAQKEYGAERAKGHREFFGESTSKAVHKIFYKKDMKVAPCKTEKKWSDAVCMAESKVSNEARLIRLNQLGHVTCYGEHAELLNRRLYDEAKSLDVNYQDDRPRYLETNIGGTTFGDYYQHRLSEIKDRALDPERTATRQSIFEQVE